MKPQHELMSFYIFQLANKPVCPLHILYITISSFIQGSPHLSCRYSRLVSSQESGLYRIPEIIPYL